jgi:NAD(P)-dependent dehydrogenase (short-subunit alcohol dehydrogenase family)
MGLKLKRLRDQVMVITGASSGIGLITAEMAAERGARLVLNSRNQKKDEPVHTADSLYAPDTDGQRRGQTAHTTRERSTYTRAAMSDMARLLPVRLRRC